MRPRVPLGARMQRRALRKGIALRFPPVLLLLASCSGATVIGTSIGGARGALVGAAVGLAAPGMVLRSLPDRRTARLEAQVPELLDAVARSLRAGRSLGASVRVALDDVHEPLAGELRPTRMRIDAGVGLRDSLVSAGAATSSAPLRTALVALAIANEAGGAQAMVLDALGASLRSRAVAGRELRGLATPVRMSATLIGLAPPTVLGAVVAIDPHTASRAYASSAGRVSAVLGVALDLTGLWWIRRLTRVTP